MKKSAKSKSNKVVKISKTTSDIPEDTADEPTNLPKKKRKKKPADNVETDSTTPPKKKRRKKTVAETSDVPAEPKPCPTEADPAAVIEASGTDVSNWEVLHVPPELLAGLAELKFEQPTEIQVRWLRLMSELNSGARGCWEKGLIIYILGDTIKFNKSIYIIAQLCSCAWFSWFVINLSSVSRRVTTAAAVSPQRRCLPAAIRGRMDVVGAAETGSGKTLAFALPVLYSVMKERQREGK